MFIFIWVDCSTDMLVYLAIVAFPIFVFVYGQVSVQIISVFLHQLSLLLRDCMLYSL